jgi:hypothetical protein
VCHFERLHVFPPVLLVATHLEGHFTALGCPRAVPRVLREPRVLSWRQRSFSVRGHSWLVPTQLGFKSHGDTSGKRRFGFALWQIAHEHEQFGNCVANGYFYIFDCVAICMSTSLFLSLVVNITSGVPCSIVEFCVKRLQLKGLLPKSALSANSSSSNADLTPASTSSVVGGLPSEFRVPYSAELSTVCVQLLEKSKSSGYVDEANFVWELLNSGHTLESLGCNLAHIMTSSIVAAFNGNFWTVTPSQAARRQVFSQASAVHLPALKQFVFVEFDDSILPSLSMSSSVTAAMPMSATRFEELLSQAAQSLLQQSRADLSLLASSMKECHGSLPRSIFSILSQNCMFRDANSSGLSSSQVVQAQAKHDDASASECYLCLLSGDDNPSEVFNSCGHGLCRNCWKSLVSAAIVSSSTPAVKSGEDLSGAVTVLSMKCSADRSNKCKAKIDFGVLCQAVPSLVQPFIRSTMSNLSRLLLCGGAGTCQCACGAVVSGVCHHKSRFLCNLFMQLPADHY